MRLRSWRVHTYISLCRGCKNCAQTASATRPRGSSGHGRVSACARLAPLALAQPFRMHGLLPHAHRPPWSPRLSLEPCAPAPLAPLACWRPSPPWGPRLPGPLASLDPHPLPGTPRLTGACPCHLRRHQHDHLPASPPRPRLRRRLHDRLIIPSFSPPMCLPFLPPCSSSGECGRVYFMFAHCDAGDDSS